MIWIWAAEDVKDNFYYVFFEDFVQFNWLVELTHQE